MTQLAGWPLKTETPAYTDGVMSAITRRQRENCAHLWEPWPLVLGRGIPLLAEVRAEREARRDRRVARQAWRQSRGCCTCPECAAGRK